MIEIVISKKDLRNLEEGLEKAIRGNTPGSCPVCDREIPYEKFGDTTAGTYDAVKDWLKDLMVVFEVG